MKIKLNWHFQRGRDANQKTFCGGGGSMDIF